MGLYMRKEIINDDIFDGENRRLIRKAWKVEKSENYPHGHEFAYQYLFNKDGEWLQVVRIDNQLHEGRPGAHIHKYRHEIVEWQDIPLHQVEQRLKEIAEIIIRSVFQ